MSLLLIALLLSPVFLWRSGLPQLSHIFAAVAIGKHITIGSRTFYYQREWLALLLFLVYVSIVSLVVYIIYRDSITLFVPIYYIFGFVVFLQIIASYIENGDQLLKYIFGLHFFMLAVVTFSSALGFGRSEIQDGIRMMFAFNNPNQMANWTIWIAVIIAVCGRAIYKSWIPGLIALIFSIVTVGFSISRSGFVGISGLVVFYCCLGVYYIYNYYKTLLRNTNGRQILFYTVSATP